MKWMIASDSTWTPCYMVQVDYVEARSKIIIHIGFNFEEKKDAEDCFQWWKELGNSFNVQLIELSEV